MIDLLKNILRFFRDALEWVVEFVTWALVKVLSLIFEGVLFVLNAIPVPEFMTDLSTNIGGIDPGILYFAQPFQLGTGIAWIVSAYVLRFLIRRIPVIG